VPFILKILIPLLSLDLFVNQIFVNSHVPSAVHFSGVVSVIVAKHLLISFIFKPQPDSWDGVRKKYFSLCAAAADIFKVLYSMKNSSWNLCHAWLAP